MFLDPDDVYFDEGYEIKTLQGKVYNIVFTKNYDGTVIDGLLGSCRTVHLIRATIITNVPSTR